MASWVHNYDYNIRRLQKKLYDMDLSKRIALINQENKMIRWLFTVECKEKLEPDEFIGITGNCVMLGNWKPNNVFVMRRENEFRFTAQIRVPQAFNLRYRYVICHWNPLTDAYNLRYWETHKITRHIYKRRNNLEQFGWIDNEYKVNRSWAQPHEKLIHFQIFNAPFTFPKNAKERVLHVKIVPMSAMMEAGDNSQYDIERLCTRLEARNLCKLTNLRNTKYHQQDEYGIRCGKDDLVLFNLTIKESSLILYRFDLFSCATSSNGSPPCLYGYGYVMPDELRKSDGRLNVSISTPQSNKTLCYMKLNYQVIEPYTQHGFTLEKTAQRHWNKNKIAVPIGHLGCGPTYGDMSSIVRENTLFSFNRAAEKGSQMIEFGVMLTKDAIPIISKDFAFQAPKNPKVPISEISLERDVFIFPESHFTTEQLYKRIGRNEAENYVFPLEAFTANELRRFKVVRFSGTKFSNHKYTREQTLKEQLPFPTLKEALKNLDPKVGFNIEVKYQQKDIDNRWACDAFPPRFQRNFYIDSILQVVLKYAGSRHIVFSSFDCNICTLLRYKQNIYPVMLLIAQPNCDPTYKDPRINGNLKTSIKVARNLGFLGLVLRYQTLEFNRDALYCLKYLGLVTFVKVPQLNELIKTRMQTLNIEGIIYASQEAIENDILGRKVFKLESEHNRVDLEELLERELKKVTDGKEGSKSNKEIKWIEDED